MSAIDIANTIGEFAADPLRVSLELPHMTTGQRKHTKKLLEEYPELQCESYGFGGERKLHVFKKGAVKVKQEEDCEALVSSVGLSMLPQEQSEMQVRNTFIHFGSASNVDGRVVKSMPHGMFKQCLLTEKSSAVAGHDTPTTTGYDTPSTVSEPDVDPLETLAGHSLPLNVGTLVVVEGLVKAPAFNGHSAVVQGWDEATGRYSILLASSGGCQQAKIKEENLRVVLPCP